jgi:hypothetical protein
MKATERMKNASERFIDGERWWVCSMVNIEYSGEWVSNGFKATKDGVNFISFVGYPTDDDIRQKAKTL